jgi:hypothetical protein
MSLCSYLVKWLSGDRNPFSAFKPVMNKTFRDSESKSIAYLPVEALHTTHCATPAVVSVTTSTSQADLILLCIFRVATLHVKALLPTLCKTFVTAINYHSDIFGAHFTAFWGTLHSIREADSKFIDLYIVCGNICGRDGYYIQGVPRVKVTTSGECSLCWSIPI